MATTIGDLVLVHYEGNPVFFARVEDITADHKPDWYHVRFLVLQVPVTEITWILREEYINGAVYTMSGHEMRLEKVMAPGGQRSAEAGAALEHEGEGPQRQDAPKSGHAKVISLADRKK